LLAHTYVVLLVVARVAFGTLGCGAQEGKQGCASWLAHAESVEHATEA